MEVQSPSKAGESSILSYVARVQLTTFPPVQDQTLTVFQL